MKPYVRMLVLLVCVTGTAVLLQSLFDSSDHKKSERIVRGYRPSPGPSLGERVEAAAPGGVWTSTITHACRGFVRVSYLAPGGAFLFDYDVPEHHIHPANPEAERLLLAMPAGAMLGAPLTPAPSLAPRP